MIDNDTTSQLMFRGSLLPNREYFDGQMLGGKDVTSQMKDPLEKW